MTTEEKQGIVNLFDSSRDEIIYSQMDLINLEKITNPSMDLHRLPKLKLEDGLNIITFIYPQKGVNPAGHHFVVMVGFYEKPLLYRMFLNEFEAIDFKIQLEHYLTAPELLSKNSPPLI